MTWFLITILAYFLNAVANVIDKTLLKKDALHPIVYTFYIAILGAILMLAFIPFGFGIPTLKIILIALLAGAIFISALIFMFSALQKDDATRITPMIGGMVPIFVLFFAKLFFNESLTSPQYFAFVFLILGSFLISLDFQKHGAWHWIKKKLKLEKRFSIPKLRKVIWLALPSAFLFGLAHALTKIVYFNTEFTTGFVWTRLGSLLAVALLLIFKNNRKLISENFKKNKKKKNQKQTKKNGIKFLFGQACGGSGMVLIQYAVFLGSVSLVNALQGIQYVFVFVFVLLSTLFFPKFLKEEFTKEIFFQKILAVILIFIGLWLIVI